MVKTSPSNVEGGAGQGVVSSIPVWGAGILPASWPKKPPENIKKKGAAIL